MPRSDLRPSEQGTDATNDGGPSRSSIVRTLLLEWHVTDSSPVAYWADHPIWPHIDAYRYEVREIKRGRWVAFCGDSRVSGEAGGYRSAMDAASRHAWQDLALTASPNNPAHDDRQFAERMLNGIAWSSVDVVQAIHRASRDALHT